MEQQTCFDWCRKQLADLAHKLTIQGFSPDRIAYLQASEPEFLEKMNQFMEKIDSIMAIMAEHPESYQHYESFTAAKKEFLEFTNWKRGQFLGLELAETA